jgi:hypothetical protein
MIFKKSAGKGAKFAAYTVFSAIVGDVSCLFSLALGYFHPLSRRLLSATYPSLRVVDVQRPYSSFLPNYLKLSRCQDGRPTPCNPFCSNDLSLETLIRSTM